MTDLLQEGTMRVCAVRNSACYGFILMEEKMLSSGD